jgi:predicted small metal-binding protein
MARKEYKQLGCLDVAPDKGCAFEVRAETPEEVLRLTAEHAKQMHKMQAVPPEMADMIRTKMRTVIVNV